MSNVNNDTNAVNADENNSGGTRKRAPTVFLEEGPQVTAESGGELKSPRKGKSSKRKGTSPKTANVPNPSAAGAALDDDDDDDEVVIMPYEGLSDDFAPPPMASNSSLVPRKKRLNEWSDDTVSSTGVKVAQSVSAETQSLIKSTNTNAPSKSSSSSKPTNNTTTISQQQQQKDKDQQQLANYKQQHTRQKRNVNILIKKGITEPIQNDYMDTVFIVTAYNNVDLVTLSYATWDKPFPQLLRVHSTDRYCAIILSSGPDDDDNVDNPSDASNALNLWKTAAEPEVIFRPQDGDGEHLGILFDRGPVGLRFHNAAQRAQFLALLEEKLRSLEKIVADGSNGTFHGVYGKCLVPPLPLKPGVEKLRLPELGIKLPSKVKYAVQPSVAEFGVAGREVSVGQELEQELLLVNNSRKMKFAVTLPRYCDRYTISADLLEGGFSAGKAVRIRVKLIPLCTTTIAESIRFTITPRRGKTAEIVVPMQVVVGPSRLIDDDSLVFEKHIGVGSFGTVARGTFNGDTVAIKSLRSVEDAEIREDSLREIEMLDLLRSPYVMELYGAVINPGGISIVLEFFALGSLGTILRDCSLTLYMKYRVLRDIAMGMRFLHAKGVVHRDIKPDNVLVSTLDPEAKITCKIADLGSARTIFNKPEIRQTNGLGTPLYMAPEIMEGSTTYAKSADVYSFAILAAEVLNGVRPFEEKDFDNSWALVNHIMAGNVKKLYAYSILIVIIFIFFRDLN